MNDTDDTRDPNNANGAADALTPTGPNEHTHPTDDERNPFEQPPGELLIGTIEQREVMPADFEEQPTQLYPAMVYTGLADPIAPTPMLTGALINATLAGVRAPFDAKKQRGAHYKGQRTRLDNRADEAVRAFAREHFEGAITEDQAIKISLGTSGVEGNDVVGFTYVEGA